MSGEIKVLKVSPTTGADVTMGDFGDKFTFASGSEIDLTGVTKTGFPAGGFTAASQWRLEVDFGVSTTSIPLKDDWVLPASGDLPGSIGSVMAVETTNGWWTYPATGVWLVSIRGQIDGGGHNTFAQIETTDDGGTTQYLAAQMEQQSTYGGAPRMLTVDFMVDIANVTTHKTRFMSKTNTGNSYWQGDSAFNLTTATFLRLGDT